MYYFQSADLDRLAVAAESGVVTTTALKGPLRRKRICVWIRQVPVDAVCSRRETAGVTLFGRELKSYQRRALPHGHREDITRGVRQRQAGVARPHRKHISVLVRRAGIFLICPITSRSERRQYRQRREQRQQRFHDCLTASCEMATLPVHRASNGPKIVLFGGKSPFQWISRNASRR